MREMREENKGMKENLLEKIERSQDSLREMREENQINLKRIE